MEQDLSTEQPRPDVTVVGDVFTHSPGIEKLAAALAAAQLKYEPLKALSVADAEKYSYRYADLAAVLAAIQPALAGQGIAILQGVSMQRPQGSSGLVVSVETRLLHASGQWVATTLRLPSGETAPQKVGALVSYLRRYGLLAMAGVASEDPDAQGLEAPPPAKPRPTPTAAKPAAPKTQPAAAQAVSGPTPAPKPAPAAAPAAAAKPDDRHQPLSSAGTITPADRGLLFKVAKQTGYTERHVKQLLFALWGYVSTSQILQGQQFGKVLSAMENPSDHGVTLEGDDLVYTPEKDANPLPGVSPIEGR